MPQFSKSSKAKLATCHPDLQDLFESVIRHIDCTILCGHRGKKEQNEAFYNGKSELKWPNSKHNSKPSKAVDVAPYVNGKVCYEPKACCYLAGFVKADSIDMGITVRWGGDWDGDGDINEHKFLDLVHFELME